MPREERSDPALSTGELAERCDVNVQTLRYYERRGILPEPPRTESGYRRYPPSAAARVRFVKRAQRLGFSLARIEELLDLRVRPDPACDEARARAVALREEIDGKLAELERMRRTLDELIAACETGPEAGECPILETLEGG